MPALLIRHRVADFATWRRQFERDANGRRANGGQGERIFRSSEDRTELWLLLEWDDLLRARQFSQSPDLIAFLRRAGVIDRPDYWYLVEPDGQPG